MIKKIALSLMALVILTITPQVFGQDIQPYITIEKPLLGTIFDIQSDVTLSGTATPNSEIILYTEAGEYAKLSSDENSQWSYTIPTVSEGYATIQAKANVKIDELSSKSAFANVTYYVKPPPIATPKITKLAQTGVITALLVLSGLLIISLTLWSYIDYRRHKRPLKQANKKVAYSFFHHLKVVSIPLLRYRLSINVYKRTPNKSAHIRRY